MRRRSFVPSVEAMPRVISPSGGIQFPTVPPPVPYTPPTPVYTQLDTTNTTDEIHVTMPPIAYPPPV